MEYRSRLFQAVRLIAVLACVLKVLAPHHAALADGMRDDKVRAAMIFNFARFTRWPERAFEISKENITICASGRSVLYTALKEIEGKEIRGKKVSIKSSLYLSGRYSECHVVIITEEFVPQYNDLRAGNALVISVAEGVESEIASIELVSIGRQTRFIVNPAAAKANGVEISSKLIDLAVGVR